MSSPTPARRLVETFGDGDAMALMYTDDVTWRLNHSLAANDEIGDENGSVVRLDFRATEVR